MNYETLFVDPRGRTSRGDFVPAMLTLLAVILFYALLVKGRTALFCMLVLVVPAVVLHARRLHDMGRSAWLLVVPTVLMLAAFAIWLKYYVPGPGLAKAVPLAAIVISAAFALWGSVGGPSRRTP
jgi:uncharacterized membrane protein YhaH (DUF805 family)